MAENAKNDDRFARMLFGENSIAGTIRFTSGILLFTVIFGTFFWWLNLAQAT